MELPLQIFRRPREERKLVRLRPGRREVVVRQRQSVGRTWVAQSERLKVRRNLPCLGRFGQTMGGGMKAAGRGGR